MTKDPLQLLKDKVRQSTAWTGENTVFTADLKLGDLWHVLQKQLNCGPWELAQIIAGISGDQVAKNVTEINAAGIIGKLPYKLAISAPVIPVRREQGMMILAIGNPFDEDLQEKLRFVFDDNIRFEIAPPDAIEIAVARSYDTPGNRGKHGRLNLDSTIISGKVNETDEEALPRLARQILTEAINKNASDLHIHPFIGGSAVRVRVDGQLQRIVILPERVSDALVRYFKTQGGMDPSNRHIPQDGRMMLEFKDREYDLRLSVLPVTGNGEKLVVRILNRKAVYSLVATGLSLDEIHTIRRMASSPSGVILFCGPTGSGKTTTLYSILQEINSEAVSISTVENPVEYYMPGLSQSEVNDKAGLTFANALRSVLRQDPDVILIGEIRDRETAQIAMQAALTGHLVFSTLHTNNAFSAVSRLFDLDIRPAVLADSLTGIVSQRLLRRLCPECRVPAVEPFTPEEIQFKQITLVQQPFRPAGCNSCRFSGYHGRKIISEIVECTPAITGMIGQGVSEQEKLRSGCTKTFESMTMSASRAIISGETTISEAVRTIGIQFWRQLSLEYKSDNPDITGLGTGSLSNRDGESGVLLAGKPGHYPEEFMNLIEQSWLMPYYATSPVEASNILHANENIYFVILTLDEEMDDADILKSVNDYRVAMAWSRLPALLRLPAGREGLDQKLRDEGATSRFIGVNDPVEDVIKLINDALTRNLDFRWGVED